MVRQVFICVGGTDDDVTVDMWRFLHAKFLDPSSDELRFLHCTRTSATGACARLRRTHANACVCVSTCAWASLSIARSAILHAPYLLHACAYRASASGSDRGRARGPRLCAWDAASPSRGPRSCLWRHLTRRVRALTLSLMPRTDCLPEISPPPRPPSLHVDFDPLNIVAHNVSDTTARTWLPQEVLAGAQAYYAMTSYWELPVALESAGHALVEYVRTRAMKPDIVVVGSRPHSSLPRILLGPTASVVAHGCEVALLAVRRSSEAVMASPRSSKTLQRRRVRRRRGHS